VKVHAYCVLSNHFHLVVTDVDARLPAFEQYVNSLVARAVNSSLGRWENFWAPSTYSAVALASAADIVEKAAYVLANPVAAGLVRHGREWPGLRSEPGFVGGAPIVATRPTAFFRSKGYLPDTAELELTPPPGFSAEAFAAALEERVTDMDDDARRKLAAARRGFLGAAKVRAQNPLARPSSEERRRELNPRIAARDKWKRFEALSRLVEFLREYRNAWTARRSGLRVAFPAGTYLLRVLHDVPCLAPS